MVHGFTRQLWSGVAFYCWHRQNRRAGFRCWTKPRIAHDRGDFHQQQTWNFNAWLVLLLAVANQLCWYVFLPQILAVYIPSFKKNPFPSRTPALALNENSVNHPSKFLTFPPEILQSIISPLGHDSQYWIILGIQQWYLSSFLYH